MKKVLFVMLVSVLMISCVSTKEKKPDPAFSYEITSETGSGLADIKIKANLKPASIFDTSKGISGFSLLVKNNSEKIIKVVWESSSLSYASQTYLPFIIGQKYIDASRPMPASVIPAKGQIDTTLFSSGQPYYTSGKYGGWQMRPIPSVDVIIILSVESGELKDYYTIKVTREWLAPT